MDYVISIAPDGEINHTLKDSFFNTRFLGDRKINRMTEILFDEDKQKFFIKWMVWFNEDDTENLNKLSFDTYEEAVAYEIEVVERNRRNMTLVLDSSVSS